MMLFCKLLCYTALKSRQVILLYAIYDESIMYHRYIVQPCTATTNTTNMFAFALIYPNKKP